MVVRLDDIQGSENLSSKLGKTWGQLGTGADARKGAMHIRADAFCNGSIETMRINLGARGLEFAKLVSTRHAIVGVCPVVASTTKAHCQQLAS